MSRWRHPEREKENGVSQAFSGGGSRGFNAFGKLGSQIGRSLGFAPSSGFGTYNGSAAYNGQPAMSFFRVVSSATQCLA